MSPATVKNNRKAAKTGDGDQPTAAAKGRPTMPQSVAAPSPFTPIVDTGLHLGNFPQAFSHLAAVEAAARIVLAERLAEIT